MHLSIIILRNIVRHPHNQNEMQFPLVTIIDVLSKSIDSSGCQQHVSHCCKLEDKEVSANHLKFIKEAAAAVCQERRRGFGFRGSNV